MTRKEMRGQPQGPLGEVAVTRPVTPSEQAHLDARRRARGAPARVTVSDAHRARMDRDVAAAKRDVGVEV